MNTEVLDALRDFADAVKAKFDARARAEPEAQLTSPVHTLIERFGQITSQNIVLKAEARTDDRRGTPDFAVLVNGTLCGHIELKAPGKGAVPSRFKGHDKKQWQRFRDLPNIIYTDGQEWCRYTSGERAERSLRLTDDITTDASAAITEEHAEHFRSILAQFLAWEPQIPRTPRAQAAYLAPICRFLREAVLDAMDQPKSPLNALAAEWRQLLFPDATNEQFADAYAQTVTFALLLARAEGADVTDLHDATQTLAADHTLLSGALNLLTSDRARKGIDSQVTLLQRVIDAIEPDTLNKPDDHDEDPWLYYYEHFLAAYDPDLRKDSGVYYTPVQVVRAQVTLIDDLLRSKLKRHEGFAHDDVITLDPAVGTGTYLIGVIDHAIRAVAEHSGKGAAPGAATALASNIYGFEIMVGPFAVSELRVSQALLRHGAQLPEHGAGIYLTDTLESPHADPPAAGFLTKPIADQHEKATEVKDKKSVIVCLGNPPYDRHSAVEGQEEEEAAQSMARTGGWVRWGEYEEYTAGEGAEMVRGRPILEDFIQPVKDAGKGGQLKNLYNLYIYFMRWALWKVFEHTSGEDKDHAGVVSFITASSYIRGDAFMGVRKHIRRTCSHVWIIDLGGEGRGTRREENVFNIQTPVAIFIALRKPGTTGDTPAEVRYARVRGDRAAKLVKLASIKSFRSLRWKACPEDWHAPLRPQGTGPFFTYPRLTDLMPWQTSGAQIKRLWPIAADKDTLERRWRELLRSPDRPALLKETRDRKASGSYDPLPGQPCKGDALTPINKLSQREPCPPIVRYAYRSFDRQWVIGDNRIGDYFRFSLWRSHSDQQLYVTSLSTAPLSHGPATTASAVLPDLHHFRGSFGARDVFPLYRDADATQPNILPGFLDHWSKVLGAKVTPESFAAYIYALLAHPAYVDRFFDELEDQELRVPITADKSLFNQAVTLGSRLLFLHTYAERFIDKGDRKGVVPPGRAKVETPIPQDEDNYPDDFDYDETSETLHVGDGEITPVAPEVWKYEVSGLRVLGSWLGYRMRSRKGKKSSPLDDIRPERWTKEFTDELLRLIWILEHTIGMHPDLARLLDEVCKGPLINASDLPPVPDKMRKSPAAEVSESLFGASDDEE